MMIKRIDIVGLFNTFDHSIEVKTDSNLTILLGQNGLGKTVILTLVNALFSYDFDKLSNYQYKELIISFDDDSELKVVPEFNEEQETMVSTIIYSKEDVEQRIDTVEIKKNRNKVAHGIPLDKYKKVRPEIWSDINTGEYYTTEEVIGLNEELLSSNPIDIHGCPLWLTTIINSMPVMMIDTRRLQTIIVRRVSVSRETVEVQDTISELIKEFSRKLVEIRAEAASVAYDLDRTYPVRLLDALSAKRTDITDEKRINSSSMTEMINNLRELEAKRRELVGVGLMQSTKDEVFDKRIRIDKDWETVRTVLNLYIEDSKKKMEVYEDMLKKISLFLDIINSHYIKKTLSVYENGLAINSDKTNEPIPFSKLSSGEQHLFVLFYSLLFKCPKYCMVLMDEPEISLNITWQKSFVSDLIKIMSLNPLSIMMATHSPSIVRNYWNYTVELQPEE